MSYYDDFYYRPNYWDTWGYDSWYSGYYDPYYYDGFNISISTGEQS